VWLPPHYDFVFCRYIEGAWRWSFGYSKDRECGNRTQQPTKTAMCYCRMRRNVEIEFKRNISLGQYHHLNWLLTFDLPTWMGFCIPSQNGGGEGRTDSLNALTTSKKKELFSCFLLQFLKWVLEWIIFGLDRIDVECFRFLYFRVWFWL